MHFVVFDFVMSFLDKFSGGVHGVSYITRPRLFNAETVTGNEDLEALWPLKPRWKINERRVKSFVTVTPHTDA